MTHKVKKFTTEDLISALREAVKTHPDGYVFVMLADNEADPDDRYVGGVKRVDATYDYARGNQCPATPCLILKEGWGMTTSRLLKAMEAAPAMPGKERTEYETDVYLLGAYGTVVGTAMGEDGLEVLVEP